MKECTFFRRFWQWPVALAVALFIGCTTFSVIHSISKTGGHFTYALDDTYIHMAMAKNFAQHGTWGCTRYHFSSSSSSLLWTFILGLVYMVFGVNEWAPLVLNVLFAILTLIVSNYYLEKFRTSPPVRTLILIGLILVFPFPGMILFGMEHVLHLLLTIWFSGLALSILTEERAGEGREWWTKPMGWLYLLGALLVASRYEGLFLLGLVCLLLLLRRRILSSIVLGITSILPIVGFGLYSLTQGWFFFPNSVMLKAGGEKLSILSILFKPLGLSDLNALIKNRVLLVLLLAGIAVMLFMVLKMRKFWTAGVLFPLLLPLMIILHLHYGFSTEFWLYRYGAYLNGFGIFALGIAFSQLFQSLPPLPGGILTNTGDFKNGFSITKWFSIKKFRNHPGEDFSKESPDHERYHSTESGTPVDGKNKALGRWHWVPAGIFMILLIVVTGDVGEGFFPQREILAGMRTEIEHCTMARFIKKYYPLQAVAVNDIGGVCFYTDARILDIFGLGDIEPLQIQRRQGHYDGNDVKAWTSPYHPEIAILQLNWSWVHQHIPGGWVKAAEVSLPYGHHKIGFFAENMKKARLLKNHVMQFYSLLKDKKKGIIITTFI